VGKSLAELSFRKDYGVNIAKIFRGSRIINIPAGTERLYPQDRLIVVGADTQIQAFIAKIEAQHRPESAPEAGREIELKSFTVTADFPYLGQSIRQSAIGQKHNCLIVGIERDNIAVTNPDIQEIFEQGDFIWVVGEKENIRQLLAQHSATP
jgi:CPA2 family monovalent cation:H+ antiporter-2